MPFSYKQKKISTPFLGHLIQTGPLGLQFGTYSFIWLRGMEVNLNQVILGLRLGYSDLEYRPNYYAASSNARG